MDRQSKAVVKVAITILANVSAISIGIAFFEQRWWAFTVATISALMAVSLAWRSEQ